MRSGVYENEIANNPFLFAGGRDCRRREDRVTKDEALEAAWQTIGGKAACNADEIAWMEAMANSADRIDGKLDASFQRALESGKIRQESSICLVAFMMEFCRLYIGE